MLFQVRVVCQRVIQIRGGRKNPIFSFFLMCPWEHFNLSSSTMCPETIWVGWKEKKINNESHLRKRGKRIPHKLCKLQASEALRLSKKCGVFCILSDAEGCSETCATASCWVEIFGRRPTERVGENKKSLCQMFFWVPESWIGLFSLWNHIISNLKPQPVNLQNVCTL